MVCWNARPFLLGLLLVCSVRAADWGVYGGPGQTRYSPSKQIDRSNVARLRVAWSYDTADGANMSQTQPIVVDGILYGVTPSHKIIALNAATGKLLRRFDSGMVGRGPNRGVTYWASGKTKRIFGLGAVNAPPPLQSTA